MPFWKLEVRGKQKMERKSKNVLGPQFNLLIKVVWITNLFSVMEKLKGHFRLTSKFSEMKTLVLQDLFSFWEKKIRFLSSVYLNLGLEKSLFKFNFEVHHPKEKTKSQKPVREQCHLTVLAGRLPPRAHPSHLTQSSSWAALNPWTGGNSPAICSPDQIVGWLQNISLVCSA